MLIRLPDTGVITSVDIFDADEILIRSLKGAEEFVLSELKNLLNQEDPDVIVLDDTNSMRWITQKATQHGLSLGFGRDGELAHGRIILGYPTGSTWVSPGFRSAVYSLSPPWV
jgi:hypothetical protein